MPVYPKRSLKKELQIVWRTFRLWAVGGGGTYEFWHGLNGCLPREGNSFDHREYFLALLNVLGGIQDYEEDNEEINSLLDRVVGYMDELKTPTVDPTE
ncbi:hypothetical protein VZG28_05230 [Synechococcus elongatus IITB4]|uniref:hypothetical protein n=1 Tax=Synechococcus elongatus TaxID=32046 RepID=UPI0030CC8D2D